MHRPAKLVIAGLLAALGASAHAFVFPSPPPGFGGTPGNWTFAPPPGAQQIDSIMRQPAHLPVPTGGGGNVKLPVAYKFGPNAAKVAAAAIFAAPAIGSALGIAAWLITAKLVYDEAEKMWRERQDPTDGMEYRTAYPVGSPWFGSRQAACSWYAGTFISGTVGTVSPDGSQCSAVYTNAQGVQYPQGSTGFNTREGAGQCPTGWTPTPAGCLSPQVQQTQFVDKLTGQPMPQTVPGELPQPTPLPVEQPVVNPTPGPSPTPNPYFVPTGDPVPNPNYDPQAAPSPENQPFVQPGIRIKPSPTATEPWRVDIEPVNVPRPTTDPTPEGDLTEPGTQPKPEEQQSLCEKHPDIVACAKMDEVEPEDVNNEDKTLTITPKGGWGNESAACPAPVTKQVAGLSLEMSWQPFCDFASGIRPVVIAMAWLSAALMVLGIARKG